MWNASIRRVHGGVWMLHRLLVCGGDWCIAGSSCDALRGSNKQMSRVNATDGGGGCEGRFAGLGRYPRRGFYEEI